MPKVHFLNEIVSVDVPQDSVLLDVAQGRGIEIFRGMWPHFNCSGLGLCGRCRVWVTGSGDLISRPSLRERFRRMSGQMRLACQVRVLGEAHVRTRPVGPTAVELPRRPEDLPPPSYLEAAQQRYLEAKEEETKKAAEK